MLKTVSTQLALASDTLPEVLAKGNTTGGTDLAVSTGDDITLADNSKVIFGAGSDLQIYSDGASGQVTGNISVSGNVGVGSSALASTEIYAYKNDDDVGNANIRIEQNGTGDAYMSYLLSGVQWWSHGIDNSDNNNWVLASNNNLIDNRHLVITPAGAATFSGNIILGTSGSGIDFSATAGTGTSELLDDYEEGVWTPASLYVTLTSAVGTYTKVGRVVNYFGEVVFPVGADGNLAILSGLPFAPVNDTDCRGGNNVGHTDYSASTLFAFVQTLSRVYFGDPAGILSNANLSGKTIQFGGTYYVA